MSSCRPASSGTWSPDGASVRGTSYWGTAAASTATARRGSAGVAFDVDGRAVPNRELDLVPVQHVEPGELRVGDLRRRLESIPGEEDGRPIRRLEPEADLEQPGLIAVLERRGLFVHEEERDQPSLAVRGYASPDDHAGARSIGHHGADGVRGKRDGCRTTARAAAPDASRPLAVCLRHDLLVRSPRSRHHERGNVGGHYDDSPMLDGNRRPPPALGSASPPPKESSASTASSLSERSGSIATVSLGASVPRTYRSRTRSRPGSPRSRRPLVRGGLRRSGTATHRGSRRATSADQDTEFVSVRAGADATREPDEVRPPAAFGTGPDLADGESTVGAGALGDPDAGRYSRGAPVAHHRRSLGPGRRRGGGDPGPRTRAGSVRARCACPQGHGSCRP